tara:strand:- start:424 stop:885 length:462 start_codon:yes stop_codon:yes gene_type:complete
MSHTTKRLFTTDFTIPDDGDTNWGEDIRTLLIKIIDALENMATMQTDELPFLVLKGSDNTITDGATLTVTRPRHNLIGNEADGVDLAALTTGSDYTDGQFLLLVGESNTATVRMDSDNASWAINGDVILAAQDAIYLSYNDVLSKWVEISRSN